MGGVLTVAVDGVVERVEWPGAGSGLRALQTAVGGCVELVQLRSDLSMWCNDEGLLNGAAWNPVATLLAISFGVRVRLHGPVVFTGGADAEGATLPLTDRQLFVLGVACDSIREDLAGGVS